jgi:hypothetical protein
VVRERARDRADRGDIAEKYDKKMN